MITVAALLPRSWSVRLVDRNTGELTDEDLDWADLVFTGGMLPQGGDTLDIVDLCRARGKPVAVGGPSITSAPHACPAANFLVLGEAEGVIDQFVEAWEAGAREGVFEAEKFQVDVTKTPIPRFDLLKFDDYLHVGVQFSRGCPFTCEFCDIIELYGRVPRAKTNAQMLAELDELYRLGYRGHIDFVDDNLIGNKKAVKAFLPDLAKWLEAHDYPFEFTTEASLNLADDHELLMLLNRANFVGVFVGIESPDTATLVAMRKKQNTRRSIADSLRRILRSRPFRARRFHHRFRQRNAVGGGCDGGADRGSGDPGLHGGPSLRVAEHAAHAPARKGGAHASSPRAQGSQRPKGRGPVHDGAQLRDIASARRKSSPTTCIFSGASMIRSPMRAASSGWRRCWRIAVAGSLPGAM